MADIALLDGGPKLATPDIPALFRQIAQDYPDTAAIVSCHQKPIKLPGIEPDDSQSRLSWTYQQLYNCSNGLANRLSTLGLRKGTSIVLFTHNCAEWALFFWAAVSLECPFVPLNPATVSNADELRHMLQVVSPGVIVVEDNEMATDLERNAAQVISEVFIKITLSPLSERYSLVVKHPAHYQNEDNCVDDSNPSSDSPVIGWLHLPDLWTQKPEKTPFPERATKDSFDDTVMIGFTSGTTSFPKACPQSSSNLQIVCAIPKIRGFRPGHRILQHSPAHHALSSMACICNWSSAATLVYPAAKFDVMASLSAIESEECHIMTAVPAMIKAFTMVPDISHRRLGSLWHVELSGAPVFPDTIQLCRDVLKVPSIGVSWGMTENTGSIHARVDPDVELKRDDFFPVGKPLPGMKVKVCAPDSTVPLKQGEEGELHAGGPQVIREYINAENESFYDDDEGHWVKTGDMASIDEAGQVRIFGRHKDIIIRGGVNIAPASIERRLNNVVGVDSQVVGIPDDMAGEVPVAVIRLYGHALEDPGATMATLQDLALRGIGQKLAPTLYIDLENDLQLKTFPMTPSGKVKKTSLRTKVQDYISQRTQEAVNNEVPTEDMLARIWCQVSGVPRTKVDKNTDISTYVDSITTMRFCGIVRRQLGKDISVIDVNRHPIIQEQARLLETRPVLNNASSLTQRTGPPTALDMAHCNGDDQIATKTRELAMPLITNLGLNWDRDVEDVMPAPDNLSLYLCATRPQTWNQRAIFIACNTSRDELVNAWKATLRNHPLMRSLAVKYGEERSPLLIVLQDQEPWWRCSVHLDLIVSERKDLHSTFTGEWADPSTGPLVKVAFAKIESEPENSALIFVANHGVFDNMSATLFFEDLTTAIKKKLVAHRLESSPGHTPFKMFADAYHHYRTGDAAQGSVSYHVDRLAGIRSLKSALWPPRRAPGCFKGADRGWKTANGEAGDPAVRKPLDPEPEDRCGLDGLTRTVEAPGLRSLREKYGIKPYIVLKTAVVLFNVRQTGCPTALFANLEAARYYPFVTKETGNVLPNPLSIAGPTFETVINRIDMSDSGEKAIDAMRRIQEDQSTLSTQSHAPLFEILRSLDSGDAQVAREILTRQIWNWPAAIQTQAQDANAFSGAATDAPTTKPSFEKLTRAAYDDVGLAWTCGLWEEETFYLNASYDDCQLSKKEAFDILGEVLSAASWLVAHPMDAVGTVDFNGKVGPLIASLE